MSMKRFTTGVVGAGVIAASGFYFSQRSIDNIVETRPEMQKLVHCTLNHSKVGFVVVDGGRTFEEQIINVRNGKSWTMRSRHMEGAAVDVAAYVGGTVSYSPVYYMQINDAFSYCSQKTKTPYIWGGSWKVKDLMHFELDRKAYP